MIDFSVVKAAVDIRTVVLDFLKLDAQDRGVTLRSACPSCNTGDLRALLVTPEKGLWYCFAAKKGGDSISLVAHVQGVPIREAAELLAAQYLDKKPPAPEPKPEGFNPEEYASKLDTGHDLVKKAGLTEELCQKVGMGVAKKGVHIGRLCFPIYNKAGDFLFFASATDLAVPKQWRGT